MFVTIGNYGIGYGIFTGSTIQSANNVHLSAIAKINETLLQSSYFKQVEILNFDAEKS